MSGRHCIYRRTSHDSWPAILEQAIPENRLTCDLNHQSSKKSALGGI
jgi:hypothetical protein